jgi:Rad3-related DNA helicase
MPWSFGLLMAWSLYKNVEGGEPELLSPLKFSNGKTQESVADEVIDLIEKGHKMIFIKGVCGSGKSAIALNIAKNFKKSSVVVPIRNLQNQYEEDYTRKKFVLKDDGSRLKIAILKGRGNFECKFMGGSADARDLPCAIDLREKNMNKIKEYIELNEFVDKSDFTMISDVRRFSVAPACPYWSPVLPTEIKAKALKDAQKYKYTSINGKEYALFLNKPGCGYYEQFKAYSKSDVLVFNSAKYMLELAIGRKPKTEVDIIDECDEFLDSFAIEKKINLVRLKNALNTIFPEKMEDRDALKDLIFLTNKCIKAEEGDLRKIKDSCAFQLIEKILENPYLAEEEDRNYYNTVLEISLNFKNVFNETYISFEQVDGERGKLFSSGGENDYLNIVSINLAEQLHQIAEGSNVLVMMSGTLHSEQVLKDIFGLKDFVVVDAETKQPGMVRKFRTGLEKNCKYSNFSAGLVNRESYLKALDCCIANADAPCLVHVSSFGDLPNEEEKIKFDLKNVYTREQLKEEQGGKPVDKFLTGELPVLWSTRCARGVDFPGDKCKSIVLTKFPYPNIKELFWKILKKEKPHQFMEFYIDKANREFIQKVARGVRFKDDYVLLFSPDSRVLDGRVG